MEKNGGIMKFTKEEARRKVLNCAKLYQQKLLNKKMVIIYRERQDNKIHYIEVMFMQEISSVTCAYGYNKDNENNWRL